MIPEYTLNTSKKHRIKLSKRLRGHKAVQLFKFGS